tara:strand:- start:2033 stop:2650 length:618 start_codon:yes stop_codon:yes gene_type:complete
MARLTGADATIFVDKIREACKKKGHAFFENGDYNLNIIGIRSSSGKADKFDDNINVLYKVDDQWVVDAYTATTEPGTSILQRPIVKKGTAILVPDQYRGAYKIDIHGGKRKYKAVCQRNAPVKVWRDDNRDRNPDCGGTIYKGMFGINIHRQWGPDDREYTGGVSAGCQVFQSSKDFYEFMETCQIAADDWGNKFTYTLLDERDV